MPPSPSPPTGISPSVTVPDNPTPAELEKQIRLTGGVDRLSRVLQTHLATPSEKRSADVLASTQRVLSQASSDTDKTFLVTSLTDILKPVEASVREEVLRIIPTSWDSAPDWLRNVFHQEYEKALCAHRTEVLQKGRVSMDFAEVTPAKVHPKSSNGASSYGRADSGVGHQEKVQDFLSAIQNPTIKSIPNAHLSSTSPRKSDPSRRLVTRLPTKNKVQKKTHRTVDRVQGKHFSSKTSMASAPAISSERGSALTKERLKRSESHIKHSPECKRKSISPLEQLADAVCKHANAALGSAHVSKENLAHAKSSIVDESQSFKNASQYVASAPSPFHSDGSELKLVSDALPMSKAGLAGPALLRRINCSSPAIISHGRCKSAENNVNENIHKGSPRKVERREGLDVKSDSCQAKQSMEHKSTGEAAVQVDDSELSIRFALNEKINKQVSAVIKSNSGMPSSLSSTAHNLPYPTVDAFAQNVQSLEANSNPDMADNCTKAILMDVKSQQNFPEKCSPSGTLMLQNSFPHVVGPSNVPKEHLRSQVENATNRLSSSTKNWLTTSMTSSINKQKLLEVGDLKNAESVITKGSASEVVVGTDLSSVLEPLKTTKNRECHQHGMYERCVSESLHRKGSVETNIQTEDAQCIEKPSLPNSLLRASVQGTVQQYSPQISGHALPRKEASTPDFQKATESSSLLHMTAQSRLDTFQIRGADLLEARPFSKPKNNIGILSPQLQPVKSDNERISSSAPNGPKESEVIQTNLVSENKGNDGKMNLLTSIPSTTNGYNENDIDTPVSLYQLDVRSNDVKGGGKILQPFRVSENNDSKPCKSPCGNNDKTTNSHLEQERSSNTNETIEVDWNLPKPRMQLRSKSHSMSPKPAAKKRKLTTPLQTSDKANRVHADEAEQIDGIVKLTDQTERTCSRGAENMESIKSKVDESGLQDGVDQGKLETTRTNELSVSTGNSNPLKPKAIRLNSLKRKRSIDANNQHKKRVNGSLRAATRDCSKEEHTVEIAGLSAERRVVSEHPGVGCSREASGTELHCLEILSDAATNLGEVLERSKLETQINMEGMPPEKSERGETKIKQEEFLPPEERERDEIKIKMEGFMPSEDQSLQQKVLGALREVMAKPYAAPFIEPIDLEGDFGVRYRAVVKHPMDLGTIATRLSQSSSQGIYRTVYDVLADIDLVWENCRTFNGMYDDVTLAASKCADELHVLLSSLGMALTRARVGRRRSVLSKPPRQSNAVADTKALKNKKSSQRNSDNSRMHVLDALTPNHSDNDGRLCNKEVAIFTALDGRVKAWYRVNVLAYDVQSKSYSLLWVDEKKETTGATFGVSMRYPVYRA